MPLFVVQKHQKSAMDLHYDFMLEKEGVLLTWSFPLPPAIHEMTKLQGKKIFDHRLFYLDFEGEIGRGLGRVDIWDRGSYEILEWGEQEIQIRLQGKTLEGLYSLSRKEEDFWEIQKIS